MSNPGVTENAANEPVVIGPADAHTAEVAELLATYFAEIQARFGHDDKLDVPTTPEDFTPPRGVFLVVRHADGTAAGCAGVRMLDPTTAEIKRMWLHPSIRGRGVGAQLLAALEETAVGLGATRGVLDTHESLTSALALYRRAGWVEVPPYNNNLEATNWFAKDLTPPS